MWMDTHILPPVLRDWFEKHITILNEYTLASLFKRLILLQYSCTLFEVGGALEAICLIILLPVKCFPFLTFKLRLHSLFITKVSWSSVGPL